jgi:hypothetical protein
MSIPYEGRAVIFHLDDGTPVAGIINRVWSTVCVNVTLFPQGESPRHLHSVGWFPTREDMARALTTYGVVPLRVASTASK